MGADGRSILHAGALLGRRFDWHLLASVTGLAEGVVLECLRRAVALQLLVTGDGFEFRHALTRDIVLQDLLPSDRAVLSRQALDSVEAAHPGLPGRGVISPSIWPTDPATLDAPRKSCCRREDGRLRPAF